MRLKTIKFKGFEGQPNEWGFDCTFGDINLIVGRNATGKTRLLNMVADLAKLLLGEAKVIGSINYETWFEHEGKEIEYRLRVQQGQIVLEELIESSKLLLQREANKVGQILATEIDKLMQFQPPPDNLAVVNRRDAIQHPFLEKFYYWATNLYLFRFTAMGQNKISGVELDLEQNLPKTDNIVAVFTKGNKLDPDFEIKVKNDMEQIGYQLETISTEQVAVIPTPQGIRKPHQLSIQEKNLTFPITQTQISNGMFRALSLLIQINYLLLAKQPSCIIIDDIGEGLDFSRSTQLIQLLIEKVKGSQIQLIMSTNDQFVMDAVPLEYWHIIQREGNQLKIYNYHNSKAIFDKFELTGLGNFDFFTSNYFLRTTPTA